MKKLHILLIIFLYTIITSKPFFNTNQNTYNNVLRKLWEEDMLLPPRTFDSEEEDSLDHCEKSNYKYFSYLLSGYKVTFDHFVSKDAAVR